MRESHSFGSTPSLPLEVFDHETCGRLHVMVPEAQDLARLRVVDSHVNVMGGSRSILDFISGFGLPQETARDTHWDAGREMADIVGSSGKVTYPTASRRKDLRR